MVPEAKWKEPVVHEHILGASEGIQPEMMRILQSTIHPFSVRTAIRQHGHNEVSAGFDNAVEFLQGLVVIRNVFQYATSDHRIK